MKTIVRAATAGLAWAALVGIASATMPMQKQAKDAGVAGVACISCHGEKMPKKGASTLNDKGKWLVAEKDKRKVKEVDGAWLKEYKEKKKPRPPGCACLPRAPGFASVLDHARAPFPPPWKACAAVAALTAPAPGHRRAGIAKLSGDRTVSRGIRPGTDERSTGPCLPCCRKRAASPSPGALPARPLSEDPG